MHPWGEEDLHIVRPNFWRIRFRDRLGVGVPGENESGGIELIYMGEFAIDSN